MPLLLVGLIAFVLSFTGTASAQTFPAVAEVEAVDGEAELQHDGTWRPVAVGMAVASTDELRTGPTGRIRIMFRANSVLLIGPASDVVIADYTESPLSGQLRLLRGKVRAFVESTFTAPGARYEIETPMAVVGVRGTDFLVVFDPVAEVKVPPGRGRTDVVGVDGRVEVHSVLDRIGHGVFVTARELTVVERGNYPTAPQRLDEKMFKQYLEGLQFIGYGRPESLTLGHPLLAGIFVPEPDRADSLPPPPAAETSAGAAGVGSDTLPAPLPAGPTARTGAGPDTLPPPPAARTSTGAAALGSDTLPAPLPAGPSARTGAGPDTLPPPPTTETNPRARRRRPVCELPHPALASEGDPTGLLPMPEQLTPVINQPPAVVQQSTLHIDF